jgi:hypothetical protein
MCFLTGRWDDALSEISSAREAPDHLGCKVDLDGLSALIAAHRQDREKLNRLRADLGQPLVTGSIRHTIDDRSWGQALAALADGDQETAFRVLLTAWQQCVAGNREYCGHYLLPDLAALAGPLGEDATARRAVTELERCAADRDAPALDRSAACSAAILDHDAGALLKVADAYAAARRPLLGAQAREHAAEAFAATGSRAEARLQLDAVQDRYARLDAIWDMARADARLRARDQARRARRAAAAQGRLGCPHRYRARGGHAPGQRPVQPGYRRPNVHSPAHRTVPRVEHPGQAQPVLARRASGARRPPHRVTGIKARGCQAWRGPRAQTGAGRTVALVYSTISESSVACSPIRPLRVSIIANLDGEVAALEVGDVGN